MDIQNRTFHDNEKKYNCYLCGHQVSHKNSLTRHKKIVHEGLKFPCGQCKHQSTSKGNLAPHNRANILAGNDTIKQQEKVLLFNKKRAVHEGVKYPCRQCNHQATSKSNLARHKRAAHEGVRFPCRYCNQQYSSKSNLTKHQRNLHL